jgi:hypothetical protein
LSQWVTTFMLGHLVVQVIGRAGSILPSVLEQLPGGGHDGRQFTVWPPQAGPVTWPPRLILGRSDLQSFLTAPAPQLGPVPLPAHNTCERCGATHEPATSDVPVPEPESI